MVKHKNGKSYTPLVLPDFVELGTEEYHYYAITSSTKGWSNKYIWQ